MGGPLYSNGTCESYGSSSRAIARAPPYTVSKLNRRVPVVIIFAASHHVLCQEVSYWTFYFHIVASCLSSQQDYHPNDFDSLGESVYSPPVDIDICLHQDLRI